MTAIPTESWNLDPDAAAASGSPTSKREVDSYDREARPSEPSKMGEYHLVLAVLESAMHDFQTCLRSTDRHGQRIFAEAATWLFDEDEHNTEGFSFAFVCDVLGLDPGSVRDRLRRTWYGARGTSMPDLDTVSVPLALAV